MKDAVGQPVPRKEDLRLITGRGTYVSDLQLPRTRHVAFLRSPHAHARITAIDTSQARQLAGVTAVFTGQEQGVQEHSAARPVRAAGIYRDRAAGPPPPSKTRFAGEAVAAVVAGSRYLAEDALALIDVDYAPLPVTVSAWQTPGSVPGARGGPRPDIPNPGSCGWSSHRRAPTRPVRQSHSSRLFRQKRR